MTTNKPKPVIFLSHNSEDKSTVIEIATKLESEHNIDVWLDKWNLIPGDPFVPAIESALKQSDGVVVFVGSKGFGSWQNTELQFAIDRQVSSKDRFPVIPVLLPDGKKSSSNDSLPNFLQLNTWVEFSNIADIEALRLVAAGVFGVEPGRGDVKSKQSKKKLSKSDRRGFQSAGQERLIIDSHDVFTDKLREQLVEILSDPGLSDFVSFLNRDNGTENISVAARSLLACEPPTESLKEILRGCNHLAGSQIDQQWHTIKKVFLNLLLRLVDPEWVQKQIDRDDSEDVRLFNLAVPTTAPSRGVEVIMARLDSRRGGILFQEHNPEPTTQIHASDIGVRDEPEAQVLVENLGLYLFAQYGEEVPERMQTHHWEQLDADLRWRSNPKHSYYFVIPEKDPRYGHPEVLIALRKYLPNLPRFILNSSNDDTPLLCSPYDIDGSVKAFWDMKPE